MKKPKKILTWDLPYRDQEPDGYDLKDVPALRKENIAHIIERHNELVQVVNVLADRLGIEFEDVP
jgi:hypothetical protein